MLSVQFKTGDMTAVPYAYIKKISYDKSGKIEIELGLEKIVIIGLNLGEGYEALVDHLVREIIETDSKYLTAPEGVPVIH